MTISLTPTQCKAARALLAWNQQELAQRAQLGTSTIADFERGKRTPTEANISQGASVPALQRLSSEGFIRQGKPGLRGRTDYRVTAAGRKALKVGWRRLIDDGPSGDRDADLRVALLALFVGGDRRLAAEFLSQSAKRKIEYLDSIEERDDMAEVAPLALWYSALRLTATKTLLEAESIAARTMAESLPRKLSANSKRQKRKSRL